MILEQLHVLADDPLRGGTRVTVMAQLQHAMRLHQQGQVEEATRSLRSSVS